MNIRSETFNRRYKRITVDRHWVDPTIPRNTKWAAEDPHDCPPDNLGTTLSMQVFSIFHIAAGHYLNDELIQSEAWAKKLIEATLNYFFGDWRLNMPNNPYHPEEDGYWARGGGSWMTIYHTTLAFAVALGDWDAAKRLSAHPTEDKADASMWQQERPWYLLLAEHFLHGTSPLYESRLNEIRQGTAKGPRVFAECLDAIAKKQTSEINQRFAEQMKYYLRNQKKRDEMEYKLALDGTILYHLARRQSHEIEMDDFTRDHLIIFDE